MVLKQIEHQLAKKVSEPIGVLSSKKWGDVICVMGHALTETQPLWQLSPEELARVQLFGLTPEALETEIQRYGSRSLWSRWLLRFFTNIDKKIEGWQYFQRCVALQQLRSENPDIDQYFVRTPARPKLDALARWLSQESVQLELCLERRYREPHWVERHFARALAEHQCKCRLRFASLVENHLGGLRAGEERLLARDKLRADYQHVQEVMQTYWQRWLQGTFLRHASNRVTVSQETNYETALSVAINVAVDPIKSFRPTAPYTVYHEINLDTAELIQAWVGKRREQLEIILNGGDGSKQREAVERLLEGSLTEIKVFAESKLERCKALVEHEMGEEIEDGRSILEMDYYARAAGALEDLSNCLRKVFKQSFLLFHPDRSASCETSLEMRDILTQYSRIIFQLAKSYLEAFQEQQRPLREVIQDHHNFVKEYQETKEARRKDLDAQLARHAALLHEMYATFAKERKEDLAEIAEKRRADLAEMAERSVAMDKETEEERKAAAQEIAEMNKEVAQEIAEMRKETAEVNKEVAEVRRETAEVNKEVTEVRKQIAQEVAEVTKESVTTRQEIGELKRLVGLVVAQRQAVNQTTIEQPVLSEEASKTPPVFSC